jgi:hypothetical protein
MGLMPEESESEEGEEYMMEEEEEAAAATGLDMEFDENDPNFAFGERKLKRVVRERDMVKKGRICTLFMQGKCPWVRQRDTLSLVLWLVLLEQL